MRDGWRRYCNYHPHGDTSIYDAMVRMSQPWKTRLPYIDMHGNNGSIDGDSPAAYRYTERVFLRLVMKCFVISIRIR